MLRRNQKKDAKDDDLRNESETLVVVKARDAKRGYGPCNDSHNNYTHHNRHAAIRRHCGENLSAHHAIEQGIAKQHDDVQNDDQLRRPPAHGIASKGLTEISYTPPLAFVPY